MPAQSFRAEQAPNNTGYFQGWIPINSAGRGAQTTVHAHRALVLSKLAGASAHHSYSSAHQLEGPWP